MKAQHEAPHCGAATMVQPRRSSSEEEVAARGKDVTSSATGTQAGGQPISNPEDRHDPLTDMGSKAQPGLRATGAPGPSSGEQASSARGKAALTSCAGFSREAALWGTTTGRGGFNYSDQW